LSIPPLLTFADDRGPVKLAVTSARSPLVLSLPPLPVFNPKRTAKPAA
jgi:hypothetical protein